MTEIVVEEACGNSPKKQFLKELYISFAEHDRDGVLSRFTDDVRWTVVGEETLEGPKTVADSLDRMVRNDLSEIRVDNIITHGDTAAANGIMRTKSGETHDFCEVFAFENYSKDANVQTIDSYVLQTA